MGLGGCLVANFCTAGFVGQLLGVLGSGRLKTLAVKEWSSGPMCFLCIGRSLVGPLLQANVSGKLLGRKFTS